MLEGDRVDAEILVGAGSRDPIEASVRHVRARFVVAGDRTNVEVLDPLVFEGISSEVYVHAPRAVAIGSGIAVHRRATFALSSALGPDRVRVRSDARLRWSGLLPGLSIALPCDALRAGDPPTNDSSGAEADDPWELVGEAGWFVVARETTVHTDATLTGEPIAWIGSPEGARYVNAIAHPPSADGAVFATFFDGGVRIDGYVRGDALSRPGPEDRRAGMMYGSGSGHVAPATRIRVPVGSAIHATPTTATSWASTSAPTLAGSSSLRDGRYLIDSYTVEMPCAVEPCGDAWSRSRIVEARIACEEGANPTRDGAIWIDASDVERMPANVQDGR